MWEIVDRKNGLYIVDENGRTQCGPFSVKDMQKGLDKSSLCDYIIVNDGNQNWRVVNLTKGIILGAKLNGDVTERYGKQGSYCEYIPWIEILRDCPEDFKSLPTEMFKDNTYKEYVDELRYILNQRVANLKDIPEEEFEYAAKILKMVKEKIVQEKKNILLENHTESQVAYKKITDEFEDL